MFFPIFVLRPAFSDGLEQRKRSDAGEVEVEGEQNSSLHGLEFGSGVGRVSDIHIVAHARWVDFLILTGNPQTGNANQLVLVLGDVVHG